MPTPSNPLDFTGRSVLITGAASGIGAACARWLAGQGAERLVLIDCDKDGLAALQLNTTVERHAFDVSDPSKWAALEENLGPLDHVVVNAGIGGFGEFAEIDFKEWRRVMDVNLDGAFLTLAAGLRAMKKAGANGRKGCSAVVTASITGLKPVPGIGPYGVAKAAVAHMARIAAAENAPHNIRVNAIAPGGVDTAIWEGSPEFQKTVAEHGREFALKGMATTTPRGTFATSDEIAGEVGFLLSDMAANITGTVHVTDGGFSF
jgi:NAD(P)-dependent dehydrogenase (short-subunit alcohol dehydrogenase family)